MTNSFRTYYVSQIDGNDTNDGLSKSSAFATLFAINRLKLQPGDRVLLARGSVFEGQFLQIKDSGTKESPIEIGAYLPESGEKFYEEVLPVIAANGQGIWYQDYGNPWMHRHMCITDMYRPQFYCMMQNILLWKIWKLQMRQARSSESSIHLETK